MALLKYQIDLKFCKTRILTLLWGDYNPLMTQEFPTLLASTDVGGYPMYYTDKDNSCLCPACANKVLASSREEVIRANNSEEEGDEPCLTSLDILVDADINYEDTELSCDNCSEVIPSAYGD